MDSSDNKNEIKEIEISASNDIKKGIYSNQAFVSHMREEFLIDFLFVGPSGGSLNSRVILSPSHFKRLLNAMTENFKKFEEKYGEVEVIMEENK